MSNFYQLLNCLNLRKLGAAKIIRIRNLLGLGDTVLLGLLESNDKMNSERFWQAIAVRNSRKTAAFNYRTFREKIREKTFCRQILTLWSRDRQTESSSFFRSVFCGKRQALPIPGYGEWRIQVMHLRRFSTVYNTEKRRETVCAIDPAAVRIKT